MLNLKKVQCRGSVSDVYGYESGGTPSGYNELITLGKPFALGELGLQNGACPCVYYPKDLSQGIQNIKTYMPKAVYWMSWQ